MANNAETPAPSSIVKTNRRRPSPLAQRATCKAAHWKNPASSSNRLMMISEMKVAVAFQTMAHTSGISCSVTTPASRARTAPREALQPTPRPLGCQMTNTMVSRKMENAVSMWNLDG
ncbi:hypothetical protein D3C78_1321550 [compost metagenome]